MELGLGLELELGLKLELGMGLGLELGTRQRHPWSVLPWSSWWALLDRSDRG